MTTYAMKVETHDPQFFGRTIGISGADENLQPVGPVDEIRVPDTVVLCNGCNDNMFPNPAYQLFLSKNDLVGNRPYDVYCEECLKRFKAQVVTEEQIDAMVGFEEVRSDEVPGASEYRVKGKFYGGGSSGMHYRQVTQLRRMRK